MKKYIFVLNAIELLAQQGSSGEEVALGMGEGVNATRQGVWQFPQGVQYGSGNGTLRGAYQGGKECLD